MANHEIKKRPKSMNAPLAYICLIQDGNETMKWETTTPWIPTNPNFKGKTFELRTTNWQAIQVINVEMIEDARDETHKNQDELVTFNGESCVGKEPITFTGDEVFDVHPWLVKNE